MLLSLEQWLEDTYRWERTRTPRPSPWASVLGGCMEPAGLATEKAVCLQRRKQPCRVFL